MPYIGKQSYDSLAVCGNNFVPVGYEYADQFIKTEFYPKQQIPPQPPQQSQDQFAMFPMSGSTSPQQPVPTLLYSQNPQLSQYGNNDDSANLNENDNVQIKTEFDSSEFSFINEMDSGSSAGSSPHLMASNEFEGSQFNYGFSSTLCDDSSSETLSSATSPTVPTGQEFAFSLSPESISRYYDVFAGTSPVEQNQGNGGVPTSFPEPTRFIIYEPQHPMNGNAPSLVPNLNSHPTYGMQMWSLPVPNNSVDNRTIASTQGPMNPLPYEYTQNQVLVNPAQINPLPSATSPPQQPQSQSSQPQQIQQQLIKCPQEDCPKTFSRLYNLKAHLRSHSPARPYQCP
ncbi:15489_t:CDS:1, partial [Acaulospora colombiana]